MGFLFLFGLLFFCPRVLQYSYGPEKLISLLPLPDIIVSLKLISVFIDSRLGLQTGGKGHLMEITLNENYRMQQNS